MFSARNKKTPVLGEYWRLRLQVDSYCSGTASVTVKGMTDELLTSFPR